MLKELEAYPERRGYSLVNEMIGKMSLKTVENPAIFEHAQFRKQFMGFD
ncbi:MAG: hypothetical protein IH596_00650 [Bacteroidales bacterium]|nr:hypothetical protein [Bacteroidales bacterium]